MVTQEKLGAYQEKKLNVFKLLLISKNRKQHSQAMYLYLWIQRGFFCLFGFWQEFTRREENYKEY